MRQRWTTRSAGLRRIIRTSASVLDSTDSDEELTAGPWEPWLAERFLAYLLKGADGKPRPVADVERALARLSREPDALSRLAAVAFLLDPKERIRAWLLEEVPSYLRRIRVRSETHVEQRRGSVRGSVDWPRTLAMQRATQDSSWFLSRSLHRTLETPELLTVRYAVDRVRAAANTVLRPAAARVEGWTTTITDMAGAAAALAAHTLVRDVPLRRPDNAERSAARASYDDAVRRAASILDVHDELLPEPVDERLADALARHALVPLNEDIRFQIFSMLALVDCIERVIGPVDRRDSLIEPQRDAVVRWKGADFSLTLHYDQAADRGVHADVMSHYFGRFQPLRPDLRLVLARGDTRRELIVDAKRSTRPSYLADAHHKMRGYIADRPHAFAGSIPKAVVMCPAQGLSPARPGDEVVFVGAESHAPGSSLERVVAAWWQCSEPRPETSALGPWQRCE
ncbi:MAG: hypothetical protein IT379_37975 [Deltaproteobacteria bacterium]|nr:hypothetical protein [Deltaproteobacteria bacterium]